MEQVRRFNQSQSLNSWIETSTHREEDSTGKSFQILLVLLLVQCWALWLLQFFPQKDGETMCGLVVLSRAPCTRKVSLVGPLRIRESVI